MSTNRAARLQFAIQEIVDILAEDITARVVTAMPSRRVVGNSWHPTRGLSHRKSNHDRRVCCDV